MDGRCPRLFAWLSPSPRLKIVHRTIFYTARVAIIVSPLARLNTGSLSLALRLKTTHWAVFLTARPAIMDGRCPRFIYLAIAKSSPKNNPLGCFLNGSASLYECNDFDGVGVLECGLRAFITGDDSAVHLDSHARGIEPFTGDQLFDADRRGDVLLLPVNDHRSPSPAVPVLQKRVAEAAVPYEVVRPFMTLKNHMQYSTVVFNCGPSSIVAQIVIVKLQLTVTSPRVQLFR